MRLIGTAGHIDHGKSTLVQALSGIHPSHLPEEHARGMTIDLGYAYLDHPAGYRLGIVDVPGHEKLVKNMVAGATGFELAVWVVDAREGVMPQSLEHLRILELLGVRSLVPVITKAALASEDQIARTRHQVEPLLDRLGVAVQAIHTVDSRSGRGISELKNAIFAACLPSSGPTDPASLYLPVDRVFSVKGIGTVVTGTLIRGRLAEHDQVTVTSQPGTWRVRSLNNHHTRVPEIGAGHRVGVNLVGLGADDIRRGDVLVAPGDPHTGRFVNVRLRWIPEAPSEWKHGARMLFYAGCSEIPCRLWGLIREGDVSCAQIELARDAHFFPGQRFILRSTNPLVSVGGGEVLDLAPDRKRRVTSAEEVAYARRVRGEPFLARYLADGPTPVLELPALSVRWLTAEAELRREVERSSAVRIEAAGPRPAAPTLIWHAGFEADLLERLHRWVLHQPPGERTVPYGQLGRELRVRPAHLAPLLACLFDRDGAAAVTLRSQTRLDGAGLVLYPGQLSFTPEEQRLADAILERLKAEGLRPARIDDYRNAHPKRLPLVDRVLTKLREARQVVRVSGDLMLHADAAAELRAAPARLGPNGVRAAEFGQAFGLSRKYSIPFLEYLNQQGILRREGDLHFRI